MASFGRPAGACVLAVCLAISGSASFATLLEASGTVATSAGHVSEMPAATVAARPSPAAASSPDALSTSASTLGSSVGAVGPDVANSLGSYPGTVNDSVVLWNDTVAPGNFRLSDGFEPTAVTYDPAQNKVFVVDQGFGAPSAPSFVSVLNGATGHVLDTVPVGPDPVAAAYDGENGEVYVANSFSGNLTVFSARTGNEVASIAVGKDPVAVAYDGVDGVVLVANFDQDTLSVVDGATNAVRATIAAGDRPDSIAFDAQNGYAYVVDEGSDSLTAIDVQGGGDAGTIPVGADPAAVTYAGVGGDLYVADAGSNNVSVVDTGTGAPVGSIPVGYQPTALAYDPETQELYVANAGSNNVSVVEGASHVATIRVGSDPFGLALDPADGSVFCANYGPSTVSVLNTTTLAVAQTVGLAAFPFAVASDSENGEDYVSTLTTNNLTVVDAVTGAVTGTVVLPGAQHVMAVDSATGNVFVANELAGTISEVDGATNVVARTVPVGSFPDAVVYDAVNGDVYVANGESANLTVIGGSSGSVVGSVPVGSQPAYLACDTANGEVFVGYGPSTKITIVSGLTPVSVVPAILSGPTSAVAYDSGNGLLYVARANDVPGPNVTVIDPASARAVGSILLGSDPDDVASTLVYDAGNGFLYAAQVELGQVSVIDGATDRVIGALSVGYIPSGETVDTASGAVVVSNYGSGSLSVIATARHALTLTLQEEGLLAKQLASRGWTAVLGGTAFHATTASLAVPEESGTGPYLLRGPSGELVAGVAPSGVLSLSTANVTEAFSFVGGRTASLSFAERGLPKAGGATERWCVELAGDSECTQSGSLHYANLTPGTYAYSVVSPLAGQEITARLGGAALAVPGTVVVNRSEKVDLQFSYDYAVTLREVGLPSGTGWSVKIGKLTETGTGPVIELNVTNGTYRYRATVLSGGFSLGPPSGRIRVDGAGAVVTLTSYEVLFTESGLPVGTNWSVTMDGVRLWNVTTSAGGTIAFYERNATWGYSVRPVIGFLTSAPSGKIEVDGTPSTLTITFAPKT